MSDLSSNSTPLPLVGTVSSVSEATILSESSGKLTVYKKLGDYVSAGSIIGEFDNAGERASVVQAEGVYEAAKANKNVAQINSGSSNQSLSQANLAVLNSISSAYSTLDDAVRTKTDASFQTPRSTTGVGFVFLVPNQQLINTIEAERMQIEIMLTARAARNTTLTVSNDMIAESTTVQTEVKTVKTYLDNLSSALNQALPDATHTQASIASMQANIALARTNVIATLSTLAQTQSSLQAATAASTLATNNAGSGEASASDAQIKQALGALQSAQARLDQTVIRSPISGTINSLPVQTGDFVPMYSQIAVVSNNGALEIVSYITSDDAVQIAVGNKAVINGSIAGIITRIAPALDPKTKKIEVHVGITGSNTTLINGQSVTVTVERSHSLITQATTQNSIPISALKITPTGSYVFTIDKATSTSLEVTSTTGILVAHKVTEGAIMGDQIEIQDGVDPSMQIVTDARGLKEGDTVSLSTDADIVH